MRRNIFNRTVPRKKSRNNKVLHPDVQSITFKKRYQNKTVWDEKSSAKQLDNMGRKSIGHVSTKEHIIYILTEPTYKKYELYQSHPTMTLMFGYK